MLPLQAKNGHSFETVWRIDKVMFADDNDFESESKTIEVGASNIKWYLQCKNSEKFINFYLILEDDFQNSYPIVNYSLHYSLFGNGKDFLFQKTDGTIKDGNREIYIDQVDKSLLYIPKNEYFRSGKLILELHGSFMLPINAKAKPKFYDASNHWGLRLMENNETKDFDFIVSGKSIKTHKLLLSTESTVLADLFKNSSGNNLDIPEFMFETVKAAIDFCYAQNISDFLENYQNALDLLIFADKYDFLTLKPKLETHLTKTLTKQNIGETVKVGNKTNSKILRQTCIDFLLPLLNNNSNKAGTEAIDDSAFDANFLKELFQQSLKPKP